MNINFIIEKVNMSQGAWHGAQGEKSQNAGSLVRSEISDEDIFMEQHQSGLPALQGMASLTPPVEECWLRTENC
jgi:hypothetical protein